MCRSVVPTPDQLPVFNHLEAIAQCNQFAAGVNIDAYLRWVSREAVKSGHSSLILRSMGIPAVPESPSDQQT